MHWKFIASEQVSMAFQPLAKFIYHNVRLTGQQTKSITFEQNFLQCIYTLCKPGIIAYGVTQSMKCNDCICAFSSWHREYLF